MKKTVLFILFLAICSVSFLIADPAEGLWKSIDDKTGKVTALWKLSIQGEHLVGEMLAVVGKSADRLADKCKDSYPGFPKAGKVNQMTLVGTPFMWGLVKKSEGVWKDGYIIAPDNGKYYYCKVTFRAKDGKKYKVDSLDMRGEIGLGIGRTQTWQRATEDEAQQLINASK